MRHQVERLKHVALRQGVKPARALTATLVAVGMMAAAAISFVPTGANADSGKTDSSLCTPQTIGLGDNTSDAKVDSGVATYVGGNMYVGANNQNNGSAYSELNKNQWPDKSYAVEAEGLTLVNGKLAINSAKRSWSSRGFRFGVVGFGGQYRPESGSDVLVVGGNSTLTMKGNNYKDVSALGGWVSGSTARGFVNVNTESQYYKAEIKGNSSIAINNLSGQNYSRSVYDAGTSAWDTGNVTYNDSVSLGSVSVNDETKDYSKFLTENVQGVSSKLLKVKETGKVTAGTASAGTYSRYHYRYGVSGYGENTKYDFKFVERAPDANQQKEKLITFTGTQNPSLEVFDVNASMLDSEGYSGISFAFTNISDTASVVINVKGQDPITFNNGWRFWWNGQEISNGYVTTDVNGAVTKAMRDTYSKAAQKIMWNFAETPKLTIKGGQALNRDYHKWGYPTDSTKILTSQDDPAAAMLGSIMVPNGSFESHVTTNGRVYVGGDFSMYNPSNIGVDMAEGATSSVIDMDQERHNLPWNGSYSTQCAAIAWDKVDASTPVALKGTTWAVYASKNDAQNQSNALKAVTDNAYGDDDSNNGSFSIGGLNPNATYYIREVSPNNPDYATNTNIYAITAGGEGSTARVVTNVYDSEGNVVTDSNKKLLPSAGNDSTNANAKIANKRSGTSIEWSKVDGTDKETLLGGSTWKLSKMNGDTASEEWTIIDDQSGTEVKSVKIFDTNNNEVASASFTNSTAQQFHAVAYDQNGTSIDNAKLTWSSADSAVAAVSENGLVTPTGNGNTIITVKSADGKVTPSFTVEVSGVAVETSVSINGYTNDQEISLEKDKTLNLFASVAPEGNTVTWSTSNADNVSLSAITGTRVRLAANSVTSSPVIITAKEAQKGKTFTLKVNVTAKQYLTLYFQAQNDWPADNVKVHYQTTNDTVWTDISMTQMDGSCNNYAYANIPLTGSNAIDSTSQFGFKYINGSGWYGPGSANVPKADKNFKFTNDNTLPEVVVISAGPSYSTTAPSGCAVTSTAAYSSLRVAARSDEHRAVASVLRTQSNVVNVEENNTVSSRKDEDTKAGKFKVPDLADGTYRLQEKTAPNGYEVSDTVYTITITKGTATWDPALDGYKLPNTRKTGTVKWSKVSSEDKDEMLSGSKWELTKTESFSWDNGTAKYTTVTEPTSQTITDCVNGEGGIPDCSARSGQYVDLNGEKGKFELRGLEWGEYQLVETKAPDGYDLDSTPHTFRIGPAKGADVTGEWYTSSDFKTDTTGAYNVNTAFTVYGGSITNTPGVVLPSTGGEGVNKMYTAGFLAVAIAVAGLALSLRRRQS